MRFERKIIGFKGIFLYHSLLHYGEVQCIVPVRCLFRFATRRNALRLRKTVKTPKSDYTISE